MANQSNILSPALFAVLIEQATQGKVKPANLLTSINADIPITYREHSASFTKERPGHYVITLYKDAQEIGKAFASSPVEAKLEVLDYVITAAREAAKAKEGQPS